MKTYSTFFLILFSLWLDAGQGSFANAGEKRVLSKEPSVSPANNKIPLPSGHFLIPLSGSYYSPIIRDTSVSPGISLYPNPVTDKKVFLQSLSLAAGEYLVQVFNVSGKKLVQQKISCTEKDGQHLIVLPEKIKPGFYSLRIEGEGYNDRTTFVVK